MTPLAAILLVSFAAPPDVAVADSHYPGASQVATWKFEPTRDEEIYAWPPGWTRRHGPGFPRYVQVRIDYDRPPSGGRCLRVDLNGGAASAFGPSIAIEQGVDYVLEGFIKTSQLQHDAAWLTLTFLDSARQKVADTESIVIGGTSSWQRVRIGPLAPPARAVTVIVGIHVGPRGETEDLHGTAAFGAIWLGRVPRVVLTARPVEDKSHAARGSLRGTGDVSFHVFARGKPIEIACLVTGFSAPKYELRLTLDDAAGRMLDKHSETFSTVSGLNNQAIDSGKTGGAAKPDLQAADSARTTWHISGKSVGYYRIHAQVVPLTLREQVEESACKVVKEDGSAPRVRRATLGLAIIDPEAPVAGSEFGWTLDPQDIALGLVPLGDQLGQSGIRSVKFPFACSFSAGPVQASKPSGKPPTAASATNPEPDRIEPLISFSERLANSGVRLVGVLLPPPMNYGADNAKHNLLAVEAFARDAKTWFPSIEPVLARLATEIRFWQIGDDRDPGWLDCTDLPAVVSRVKVALDQIGQDFDVGVAWNLAAPLPVAPGKVAGTLRVRSAGRASSTACPKTPWTFLALPCDGAMSNVDLAARLNGTKSAGVRRWLAIDALPETGHSSDERIAQLVGRLIAAKMHGAEGIFFAHPFDSERGLVGRDGSPSELFLPWRTTALTLGGAPYAGDIDLAGSSRIHCFGSHGTFVGVLVGDAPKSEAVYLGNGLRMRDLWGRITECRPTIGSTATSAAASTSPPPSSVVEVQRLPVFLTGLDGPIAEWQLNASFAPQSLPSSPLSDMAVSLEMKNPLPRAVSGRVRITPPRNWYIQPDAAEFRIEPGAAWKLPLKVVLPNDVLAGRQMVALEFEIQSNRFDHFTMYRPIEVTLGDVAMDARAALTEHGDLEVRQTLSNQGKLPVYFRCDLMAPDRRRQSTEIFLRPDAKSDFAYRLPDGRELLGKSLWLRAEEINGPRVLNCRLDAPAAK
jgi:hypothetical protein